MGVISRVHGLFAEKSDSLWVRGIAATYTVASLSAIVAVISGAKSGELLSLAIIFTVLVALPVIVLLQLLYAVVARHLPSHWPLTCAQAGPLYYVVWSLASLAGDPAASIMLVLIALVLQLLTIAAGSLVLLCIRLHMRYRRGI
jgi:hypothetical protein